MMRGVAELVDLLLEFELAHRLGRVMASDAFGELTNQVRALVQEEYWSHSNEYLVRNKDTEQIAWVRGVQRAASEHEQLLYEVFQSGDWINELAKHLDRLLSFGTRRQADRGNKVPPPRLAVQVARALKVHSKIGNARQLAVDAIKHAMYDAVSTEFRRRKCGGEARVAREKQPRKRESRALLRHPRLARALLVSPELHADLGWVLAYEYQGGGYDPSTLQAFEHLVIGNSSLAAVRDAIDAAMRRQDDAQSQSQTERTRRKPARTKGIGAQQFALILGSIGIELRASSLPKLYARKRAMLLEALPQARGIE